VTTCSNCGASLVGDFCHMCGQKKFVESDRRLSHLLRQFLASATDLDGRIWRTVRALLFKPGLLTREYFEGRRARWISPVSLFLAVTVIYFFAPFHGSDLSLQFSQQVSGRMRALALAPDETLDEAHRAGVGQAHTPFTEHLIDERVRARDAAARQASNGASGYSYHDYRIAYDAKADDISKALVILHMPFAALALMLVFVRQRRYFAEHFVAALHYFAFAMMLLQIVVQTRSLTLAVLPATWFPPEATWDWIMRVLLTWYAVTALRRAYAVSWIAATGAALVMLTTVVVVNLFVYRAVQFLVTFALT
jgi:Protein of unknown function (DUF3667)